MESLSDQSIKGSRNSHRRRPTTLIPLRRHNLVVERAQLHSETGPHVEMVCGGDSPTRALGLAHGPVLIEGRGSLDGGLIGAGVGVYVVGGAVGGDAAFVCGARRGVVGPEGLDDVVLDEGRGRPAVDGEVAVAAWRVVGGEGDRSGWGWRR